MHRARIFVFSLLVVSLMAFGASCDGSTDTGGEVVSGTPSTGTGTAPVADFGTASNEDACGTCDPGYLCIEGMCQQEPGGIIDDPGVDPENPPDEPATGTDDPDDDGNRTTPEWDDQDGDGVLSNMDNCPTVFNADQADLDGDWVGDVCDPDIDDDGYLNELDCEPTDKLISPGHAERCGNGTDDNCNELIDEEGAVDCRDYFVDGDGDGAGEPGTLRCLCTEDLETGHTVKLSGDCDDSDPLISPLLLETCDDLDNNCNLLIDEGCDDDDDGYCDWDLAVGADGFPSTCPNGGGDCYDYSPLVHPGATEIDGDGLDNDCDGNWAGEAGAPLVPNCTGPCTGTTTAAALCAMDICYAGYTGSSSIYSPTGHNTSGAFGAITHYGNGGNDLQTFAGESYFIMASGMVDTGSHQDWLDGFGSAPDPFANDGWDMQDAVEFSVTLTAPPGVTGFSIDYIFMSAEYEEWIGTSFNDKFYIIVNAPQTTQNQDRVANYTQCSNPSIYYDFQDANGKWCYIAINTAFSEPCFNWTTDISGTGYECGVEGSSTGWLTTLHAINAGETFQLRFHIHDTSDQAYDSAVILDNFQWQGGAFTEGTVTHK